jgi:hypothetical protein
MIRREKKERYKRRRSKIGNVKVETGIKFGKAN